MNRKIKFRGKRVDNGKWVYGNLQQQAVINEEYYITSITSPHNEFLNNSHIIDSKTVGQYTGLKDKNGVEIYEGDLLRYSEDTSEISGIDEVFYNEEYGTFEVAINRKRNDTEVLGFYLSRLGIGTKYEVIGNIYESEVTND